MAVSPNLEAGSDVQLLEVVAMITLAADLALGQPLDHVLRSCAIATRFAEHLGASEDDRRAIYWVSLLTTAGCTTVSYELSKAFGDDIALRAGQYNVGPATIAQLRYMAGRAGGDGSALKKTRVAAELLLTKGRALEGAIGAHCAVNVRLADGVGLDESVLAALRLSFARWDGKGIPRGVRGADIPLAVRISAIADPIEVHHRERGVQSAIDFARAWSGKWFDPDIVDAWSAAAPEVLAGVDGDAAWDAVSSAGHNRTLTVGELEDALELVADYSDLKSPWFSGHSRGVATLAESAARHMGLPAHDVQALRQAALLHDLGRNAVPNSIWDKAGPLTDDEWERVRLHAYHTGRILHRSGRLIMLASIASAAHERSGGTGYPRAIAGETIPVLGRILECADAYHAMLEARPHRPALSKDAAAQELRRSARAGELDAKAVDAVLVAAGHPARRRSSAPGGLTPREVEVLELAARGATTRQVARRLGISPKTAGNHIERIYMKIAVSSRAEAAMWAMQNGLLRTLET